MTALALVLLVLGFLFATLQYPALMRRFWKWTLICVASLAAVVVLVIVVRDANKSNEATLAKPNPFDQFDAKPDQKAQHGPWEDFAPHKDAPAIVKPEYYDANGRITVKPKVWGGNSLEERIDQALERSK